MLQSGRSRVRFPMISFNVFQFTYPFQPQYGPGVYSTSNRNGYQKQKIMFVGSRARPVRKTGNLTAIYDPTV
jgi:hypothetical protein